MKEYVMIGVLSLGPALYALGGTGLKFCRRFILPVILGTSAFLLDAGLLPSIGVWLLSTLVFHLGYGENTPILMRGLTILAHGLCLAPLIHGHNALIMILPPLAFGIGYWLSRKFNWFTWKIVEAGNGFIIGASLILMSLWR